MSLTLNARRKIAYSTGTGHWQYWILPFQLHGTPATFQWLMDIVLHPLHQFIYLDDVVIHSIHVVSYLHHLRKVLGKLGRAGLTTNPQKCHLGLTEAQYQVLCIG